MHLVNNLFHVLCRGCKMLSLTAKSSKKLKYNTLSLLSLGLQRLSKAELQHRHPSNRVSIDLISEPQILNTS